MALITDLFDYFREPWAYAIYHDKFQLLLDDLNSLMTSTVVSTPKHKPYFFPSAHPDYFVRGCLASR